MLEHIIRVVISVCSIFIILEAILSINYHCNKKTRIAHWGRISRIVTGIIIITGVIII